MIERFFLDNPHRATLILEPDPDLADREEAAEREQLKTVRESLPPAQLEEVIANTRELKRLQEQPDSPEALADDSDPENCGSGPNQQAHSPGAAGERRSHDLLP